MPHAVSSGSVEQQIILRIWPPHQNALSFDPASVAALFHLQLAIPGRFSVAYSANPDSSPSGQLPYLTHGLHSVSTLPSVLKYIAQLPDARDLNESLSAVEKAQLNARIAHVESSYGDLVAHMLYSLRLNWWRVTRPALVSILPVPHRYYVPARIRESYRPRLEAAELWDIPGIEREEEEDNITSFQRNRRKKKEAKEEKNRRASEREKVTEKARAFLSSYATLLGDRQFFHPHADRPTTLDVVFAAHTHILTSISFTDPLLQSLLSESYPALVAHASAVQSFTFPDAQLFPPTSQPDLSLSLKSLLPRLTLPSWKVRKAPPSPEEERFRIGRWGWMGLVAVCVTAYLTIVGSPIHIRYIPRDEYATMLADDDEEFEDVDEAEEEDAEYDVTEEDKEVVEQED